MSKPIKAWVKERPILFSGPMVQAILDGRKTQTRRVIKPQPGPTIAGHSELNPGVFKPIRSLPDFDGPLGGPGHTKALEAFWADENRTLYSPFGVPGDRLWVRETWQIGPELKDVIFAADGKWNLNGVSLPPAACRSWKPSIHMPRALSRIILEITGIRVERVQEISEEDCLAEGVDKNDCYDASYVHAFSGLWEEINAKRGFGWDANPWVWAIEFKRTEGGLNERQEAEA